MNIINVETAQITRTRGQNDNEMKTRHGETKRPRGAGRTVTCRVNHNMFLKPRSFLDIVRALVRINNIMSRREIILREINSSVTVSVTASE